MKKTFTLVILLQAFCLTIFAQEIDQVSVGANYSFQAYYNISSGEVTQVANDAWDIAFGTGAYDAGVFLNEAAGFSGVPLEVYLAPISSWDENIESDTIFKDDIRIYNEELDWILGAFNTVKTDPESSLDFGWGVYNTSNNKIESAKIFVIKLRDGSFKKLEFTSLEGGGIYSFRTAGLDGSDEKTYSVTKSDGGNDAALVHFSFTTEAVVDIPSDADLIFSRYTTPLDAGDGTFIEYTVTGVLLAPGAEVAVANEVDPETVSHDDYVGAYTSLPKTIGHEWKGYDFTLGWVLPDDRAYFIKGTNGDIFKTIFLDFEGSSTGTTTIEKTFVGTTGLFNQNKTQLEVNIFPNPASDYLTVTTEENSAFDVLLYDMTGRKVLSETITNGQQINLSSVSASGMYTLHILSQETTATQLINIQK